MLESALAAKQQAEQRHNQNVARGEESGLADRRIQQRELLGDAARAQRRAAAHTADNERFASFAAFLGRLLRMRAAAFAQHRDDRQQDQSADDVAREHKGERADILHADTLRHKGHTPNRGRQQQKQRVSQLHICFFSLICGFFHKKRTASKRFFRGAANQI